MLAGQWIGLGSVSVERGPSIPCFPLPAQYSPFSCKRFFPACSISSFKTRVGFPITSIPLDDIFKRLQRSLRAVRSQIKCDGGADFFDTPICEGVCLNTGQVCECVNESLCALRGEAKQRQSQKCNPGVKSSVQRENERKPKRVRKKNRERQKKCL